MRKFDKSFLLRLLSYVLVAAVASAVTWCLAFFLPNSKLELLSQVITNRYIGGADKTAIEDQAAHAMVAAIGDKWSYYIPAAQYQAHVQNQNNEYVGIGVTIQKCQDGSGFAILAVEPNGPAAEAGILAGDIATHADGTFLGDLTIEQTRSIVMGKKNTQVVIRILRDGESMDVTVTRKTVHTVAAEGTMLDGSIGYIYIRNFSEKAGSETIEEIEKLLDAGAQKLIFDVRDNPGGFVHELVKVLDYLLPEGPLFRSVSYTGKEDVDTSGPDCLEIPIAVLMNGNSYSAAELFAAALSEYDWAVTVGEPTTGKAHYQTTIMLGDGSAVSLSTGAYTTPNGVNLTEVGGLQPDVAISPAQTPVSVEEDPQVLAAITALAEE